MSNPGERVTPPDPPESTRSQPLRLVFIRHGSSTWNDERRIQGQLDPPLSEKGREQARKLGYVLPGERVYVLTTPGAAVPAKGGVVAPLPSFAPTPTPTPKASQSPSPSSGPVPPVFQLPTPSPH